MDDTTSSGPPLRGLAVFMGAMTSAWSLNADPAAPAAVTIAGVALGILVVVLAVLIRPGATPDVGPATGRATDPAATGLTPSTVFRVAVAAELIAGVIAVVVIARAGLTDYIQPVIALVVALHFPIFLIGQRFWLHLAAGIVGGLGAGLAIVLLATGTVGPESARAIAGLSLAACTLAYGIALVTALRRPVPLTAPPAQRTAGRSVSA